MGASLWLGATDGSTAPEGTDRFSDDTTASLVRCAGNVRPFTVFNPMGNQVSVDLGLRDSSDAVMV